MGFLTSSSRPSSSSSPTGAGAQAGGARSRSQSRSRSRGGGGDNNDADAYGGSTSAAAASASRSSRRSLRGNAYDDATDMNNDIDEAADTSSATIVYNHNRRYAHANEDEEEAFCNSFWGTMEDPSQDRGYETLMGRTKNANKMLDDFRAFFKERAAIEDEYARRLAKLARMPLGKDERGQLSTIMKRVQLELDQSGRCHAELANVIRQSMESRVREFENARDARRKNAQAAVERSYKNKLSQEAAVHKAMEKYKSDCILINSFSARLALTQGKDLDKVTQKLDKAQQTVQVNEAEYRQYCRALKDSHTAWLGEWKSWCDLAQDLEEERFDFVRNALWSYVNAVSLICVKDDESCENVRQTVESCDLRREMADFVHHEGSGNMIQDPPHFIDFSDGDKGAAPPAIHPAKYARSSAKVELAPFDGLERLQAAIYPQSSNARSGGAGTPASRSAPITPVTAQTDTAQAAAPGSGIAHPPAPAAAFAAVSPAAGTALTSLGTSPQPVQQQSQSNKQTTTSFRSRPTSGADMFPQAERPQSRGAAAAGSTTQQVAQPVQPEPPAPFEAAQSERSKSRPPSRAGAQEEAGPRPPSAAATTAEKLQYMASQKRLSAAAFRVGGSTAADVPASPSSSASNPHYPYASASPRQAKPYEPPANAQGRVTNAAPSAPTSTSAAPTLLGSAPPAPVKKEEDPLLAALAKLRNPSSAVDVLPPSSPAAQSGLPSMSTRTAQVSASTAAAVAAGGQTGAAARSQSPYMQKPAGTFGEGRKSPSQPALHKQYTGPGSAAAAAAAAAATAPRSQTSGNLAQSGAGQYGSLGYAAQQRQYQQASRSRPASPQHPPPQQAPQVSSGYPGAYNSVSGAARPPSRGPPTPSSGVPQPASSAINYGYPATTAQDKRQSFSHQPGPNRAPSPATVDRMARSPSAAPVGYTGSAAPANQGRASPVPGYGSPATYGSNQPPTSSYAPHQQPQPSARPPSAYGGAGVPQQQQQQQQQRPVSAYGNASLGRSTTPIGIALDEHGQVTQDQLAEQYHAARYARSPTGHNPAYQRRGSVAASQQQQSQAGYTASPSQAALVGPAGYPASPAQSHPQAGLPPSQQSSGYRRGASIYAQSQQNRLSQGPGSASPAPAMVASPSAPVFAARQPSMPASQSAAPMYGGAHTQSQAPAQYGYDTPGQSPAGYPGSTGPAHSGAPYYNNAGSSVPRPPSSQNIHRSQSVGVVSANGQPGYGQSGYQPAGAQQPAAQMQPSFQASYGRPGQVQQPSQPLQQHQQVPSGYRGSPAGADSASYYNHQQQQSAGGISPSAYASSTGHPSQQPLRPPAQTPPTNQFSESGKPIQFYVRAIYKYDAQSGEEFSFQKDDVIAVTETEEDGWWHGFVVGTEGLSRPGGDIFPSNFVTLLE